jgi:hypothetical protein
MGAEAETMGAEAEELPTPEALERRISVGEEPRISACHILPHHTPLRHILQRVPRTSVGCLAVPVSPVMRSAFLGATRPSSRDRLTAEGPRGSRTLPH